MHFPDTDPRWAGADSIAMLRHVVVAARRRCVGGRSTSTARWCANGRSSLRASDEMQAMLTSAVGAPVSIKGNRAEQIGAIGRGEGIVCFATALIARRCEGDTHESSTHGPARPGKPRPPGSQGKQGRPAAVGQVGSVRQVGIVGQVGSAGQASRSTRSPSGPPRRAPIREALRRVAGGQRARRAAGRGSPGRARVADGRASQGPRDLDQRRTRG